MRRGFLRAGFTLIEILIVVVILGILASLVIPQFATAAGDSSNAAFSHSLKTFARLITYEQHHGGVWPADRQPGDFPTEMTGILDVGDWNRSTPLGGSWDYDRDQFGVKAAISVYRPTRSPAQMIEVDRMIDDGNLMTGAFRQRTDGYMWVLQE